MQGSDWYEAVFGQFGGALPVLIAARAVFAMVLAMAAVHVGWARAVRADARRQHRTVMVTLLVFFAISAWAIPWPGRVVGRPLFRTTL